MVDIHCHILPSIDDGATSWEMAVDMCRMAANDGIEHIVATPHANDEYAYDRSRNQEALARLGKMCGGQPKLSLGCDFHLSYENVQAALRDGTHFTVGATRYLLVEFSHYALSQFQWDAVARLQAAGLRPVITHPERYPLIMRNPEQVLRLVEGGCVMQVTASSLTGYWGEASRKTAEWMLQRQAIHVLATDAHDTVHRTPILSAARQAAAAIAGEEAARAMVEDNPAAIVAGQALPWFPQLGSAP